MAEAARSTPLLQICMVKKKTFHIFICPEVGFREKILLVFRCTLFIMSLFQKSLPSMTVDIESSLQGSSLAEIKPCMRIGCFEMCGDFRVESYQSKLFSH